MYWLGARYSTMDGHLHVIIYVVIQVVLEVAGEKQLRDLAEKLEAAGVRHKLWIEQPEDYATCLATAPYPKSTVAPLVKKLKLCKGT